MAKEKQVYPICETCTKERRPVMLAGGRRKTMARTCDCGIFTIEGKKINIE
jgi:hypothetical protein